MLNVYENNKAITMLFANEINKIDKKSKLNLKKFI